ncbi:putative transporter YycB [Paenibacillus sp. S02]|uniref:MFS transporter n=2 Tax=Paenibacillus TaxID=44249 RepID=UPI00046E8806|nr:MFS transporter [Paenibacillus polymyxa]QYK69450.1 putative transporter YycB [Paenibacillus sp. S02]
MRLLYLIMIIFFISLNLRPSITSVGPLLDVIQDNLGLSGVTSSLITALPIFCMGLFSLSSIWLQHRLGVERSLLVAMLLILLATFLRMFVHHTFFLLATALCSGVGIGIAGPLIAGFIKKYFPEKPGLTGLYSVSMVIGAAVASSFSVPLFQQMDSWQHALSFWSILAVPAVVLLLPLLQKREVPKEVPKKNLQISAFFIKNKRVHLFTLFFGCMAAIFYAITAWLAPIVQATGLDRSQSGMTLTLFTLVQIPVSFLIPLLVGKSGNRRMWLLLCGLSEFFGIILLMLHFSPWVAAIFLGMGAGGLFPLALLIPIEEAAHAEEATSWSAMMQFGGYLLGSLGPTLIGLSLDLFETSIPTLFLLAMIICTMIGVGLKIGNKTKKLNY